MGRRAGPLLRSSAPIAHDARLDAGVAVVRGAWRTPGRFIQLCGLGTAQRLTVLTSPVELDCTTRYRRIRHARPIIRASFRPSHDVADPMPSLAFVFPGQGSQSVGMLSALAARDPGVRATFDEASTGAGIDLWTLSQMGPDDQLNRTEATQPALLAAGVAVWRSWQARGGAMPSQLAGHSLGEYAALVAAEAITLHDAARLVRLRGQLMQEAAPSGVGAMAAVLGADDDVIAQACVDASVDGAVVVPANFNSPGQVVIGGHTAAVDAALALLAERGVRKAVKLTVSVPSHTPLMREAANRLSDAMRDVAWRAPRIPVVQNVDGDVHDGIDSIRDALVRQLYLPVQWTQCVQLLVAHGASRILECGPGKVLTGLVKRIDKSVDARAIGAPDELDAALAETRGT